MSQPTVAVDLDGVIFEYKDWKGLQHFGKPIKDVKKALKMLRKMGFKIVIFTCRANPAIQDEPLPALELYIRKALEIAEIPFDEIAMNGKPFAAYYIDDRGIRFETWEDTMFQLTILEKARADKFE